MQTSVSKRTFSVAPNIIMSLIKAQAGTLAKAVLECVQNSADAGASEIRIDVEPTGMIITDNGRGFVSREQIEELFEVFGFDHEGMERTFGQFGIGRAQLWSFASTRWLTNGFEMHVDVRKRGLDYDLVEGAEKVNGLRIEATLYEPMRTVEQMNFERELEELCEWAMIPVYVNGKRISKDPAEHKWTYETEDAYIRTSQALRQVTVFNLGVRVRDYPAYQFGIGAVVVTKGKRLALNMARTDILVSTCQVWKRIRPFLVSKGSEVRKKATRMTEDQLTHVGLSLVAGELSWQEVESVKLITDVCGKKLTIGGFVKAAMGTVDKAFTVVYGDEATGVAESSHRNRHCFVLSGVTLGRFGVTTATELLNTLRRLAKQQGFPWYAVRSLKEGDEQDGLNAVDDWRKACRRVKEGYEEVPKSEWSKQEWAIVDALYAASEKVRYAIIAAGASASEGENEDRQAREVRIGVSATALAWTDGEAIVWFNRDCLNRMKEGLSGLISLIGVLVHEYLHEGPSTGTHSHDLEFYERFEAVMANADGLSCAQVRVGDAVEAAMKSYVRSCAKLGIKPANRTVQKLDEAEQMALFA